MSRIRSIHPTLFSDEAYMGMSVWAKAAWPALWTECDDHGAFEWKPIVLKARIFPADHIAFEGLLEEWERCGSVKKFEIEGKQYGLVRNFCKYQRPKKPKYRFAVPDELRTFAGITNDSREPVPHQSPTGTENPPQMKDGGGKRKEEKKDIRRKRIPTLCSDEFQNQFWKPYPRTPIMSKAVAWAEWQKLTDDDRKSASLAVPKFIEFLKSQKDHPAVHACRFLRQRRFDGFGEVEEAPDILAAPGFYAAFASEELDAWAAHERLIGKSYPRDKAGGWRFPTQWPPKEIKQAS